MDTRLNRNDIDEMPFDEVIALHYKIRQAYLEDNEENRTILAELKIRYPALFEDKELARLVRDTANRVENINRRQNPGYDALPKFNVERNKFTEH